jgi:hypothetical protein
MILTLILNVLACCGLGLATAETFTLLKKLPNRPFHCGHCWALWWAVAAQLVLMRFPGVWNVLFFVGLVSLVHMLVIYVRGWLIGTAP